MNRHPKYDFITEKLAQMPAPDMNALWDDMKVVLDREMPEEKKKRRFFFWWFFSYGVAGLLCLAGFTALALYFNGNFNSAKTTVPSSAITSAKNTHANASNTHSNVKAAESTIKNTSGTATIHINTSGKSAGTVTSPGITSTKNNARLSGSVKAPRTSGSQNATSSSMHMKVKKAGTQGKSTDAGLPQYQQAVAKPNLTTVLTDDGARIERSPAQIQQTPRISIKAANLIPVQTPSGEFKNISTSILNPDSIAAVAHGQRQRERGFTIGLDLPVAVPLGKQTLSMTGINGTKNPVLDYLPAAYARFHFNRKWSLEGGLRLISPQYTKPVLLSDKSYDNTVDHYKEREIYLEKLYYIDVPVTARYQFNKKFSLGSGIQYSYLKRSVLKVEDCNWDQAQDSWMKTWSEEHMETRHNPTHEKKEYANAPANSVDSVGMVFRPHDFRMLLDANYQFKKLSAGVRFNLALNPYVNTKVDAYGSVNQVKESNRSMQLYIRYQLWDKRRKN